MKLGKSRSAVGPFLLLLALAAAPVLATLYNRNVDVHTQGQTIPSGPNANDIKVCLIDTGVTPNRNLPPLTDGTITGESFVGDLYHWKDDPNGLGTAVAGVIMAHGRIEEDGVVGMVQDAGPSGIKLHVARALGEDRNSRGKVSEVFSALYACREAAAKIIVVPFNVEDVNGVLRMTINKLYDEDGILFVGAAGNLGDWSYWFPASHPAVISVAATATVTETIDTSGVERIKTEVRADFSNYNDQVEISAVGDRVRTTWRDGGFAGLSMTEMAAGAVAGGAALLWSYNSDCSAKQIRGILLKTAKQMGRKDCNVEFGWGHLRVQSAIDQLTEEGCAAGDDEGEIYLDADGKFAGCPATEVPSAMPSVSAAPTQGPTVKEPTFAAPTHSPSFTGHSKSEHHYYHSGSHHHSKSHHHHHHHHGVWEVGPQCEETATVSACCDQQDCWWDSTLGMCTRFEIDDPTCKLCLLDSEENPTTPKECCALEGSHGCLWDSSTLRCTGETINDMTCRNMSEEPSAAPSDKPTFHPTSKPTKTPTTDMPTVPPTPKPTKPPTTGMPTVPPTPKPTKPPNTDVPTFHPTPKPTKPPTNTVATKCVDDKKHIVVVKGKESKCEKAGKNGWCKKNDENSAGNVLIQDICCSWC